MELYNLNITLGKLLSNQKAKAILAKEFPTLINTPLIKLYQNKTLNQIISLAKGKVSEEKIKQIIKELEQI